MALRKVLTEAVPPPEPIACAYEGCRNPALVRVRTQTGWANLCVPHYAQHWGRELGRPKPEPRLNPACKEIREVYLRSQAKGEKPMAEYVEEVHG